MVFNTPTPPYYSVIFSSQRNDLDHDNYEFMAIKMVQLAQEQQGFLGYESYRNNEGIGVTISYWETLHDISEWKRNMEHREAQKKGRELWYDAYSLRIAKIERDYFFQQKDEN